MFSFIDLNYITLMGITVYNLIDFITLDVLNNYRYIIIFLHYTHNDI